MKTVTVDVSKRYDVIISNDLIDNIDEYLKNTIKSQKIAVVTDSTVDTLYYSRLETVLKNGGYDVVKFAVSSGEKSKNAENYVKLINFLAQNRLTRCDCVTALGGGVVGDLAGFAAATYLRGTNFVQIPTTLLAAVDSSVGGKTAIDLESGKNLAGVFYQPSIVLCDYSTLSTLSDNTLTDGLSEVIKYAIIGNQNLYNHLMQNGKSFDTEYVIYECIKMKRNIVQSDEFDTGIRMLLNFGHTAGHAIEAASGYSISHGSAVATGMMIFTRAAYKYGFCDKVCLDETKSILNKFGFALKTQYSSDELFAIMTADKKRNGQNVKIVVPEKIGKCVLKTLTLDNLKEFLKAGI